MKKKIILLLVLLVIAIVLRNTFIQRNDSDEQKTSGGEIESIVIGVPNWKSAMGTAYILRELIKKNFDMEVRLQSGTDEELYAGIANGTVHIHPEGWTPNHNKWHTHLSDLLERNKNGIDAAQGLCLNKTLAEQYNITHIKDLLNPGITQHFDTDGDGQGEIWIGAKDWSTTAIEKIRAKSYGYNTTYELLQMDESTALQQLEKATAAGKLFAIHCYTPHWMHRAHNLYQLKEPTYSTSKWKVVLPSKDPQWLEKSNAAVAWEPARLHIYYAKSLKQQHPSIAQLLKRTQFTMSDLLQITHDLEKGSQDPATYAQQWVAENR